MTEKKATRVRERQNPLRERYKTVPDEAMIVDRAKTTGGTDNDPFHGRVVPGSRDYGITWPFGIHHAVGGYHDAPNPGDLLCAALAACLDSTIRMIADHLDIVLTALEVDVAGHVDVSGSLLVERSVPVGFQSMRCSVDIQAAKDTNPKLMKTLLSAAENSCVVMQTLRAWVAVETHVNGAAHA